MEGYRLLETKDFTRAIALVEEVVALDPSGESYYNSACFLARAGRVKEALGRLQEAIARNPKLAPRAAQDRDLESLRDTDGFKKDRRQIALRKRHITCGQAVYSRDPGRMAK